MSTLKDQLLLEKANANVELLFQHWGVEYEKITPEEYDFKNPTRKDEHHGACRFNCKKGVGNDFTGQSFTESDWRRVGVGLTKNDFANSSDTNSLGSGFNLIVMCQRLYNLDTYRSAATLLARHLDDIAKETSIRIPNLSDVIAAQRDRDELVKKKLATAKRAWSLCQPIEGTLGEKYLQSRSILLKNYPESMRFFPRLMNYELRTTLPALVFKASRSPTGDLEAIHRIYLKPDGSGKAEVNNAKLALGSIKGLGLWFGDENDTLCIVEGPENALSILSLGFSFVVSTINAPNFSNLTIPPYVSNIRLFPDGDDAGVKSANKAFDIYSKVAKVRINYPPKRNNNKKHDWNDELQLMSRGNGEKEE